MTLHYKIIFRNNNEKDGVIIETDFSSNNTVFEADLMISDWSGVASEYLFTTNHPVLYVDTPMKVMNPEYTKIDTVPLNIWIREVAGKILPLDRMDLARGMIEDLLEHSDEYSETIKKLKEEYIYNLGNSSEIGARYIIDSLFEKVQKRNNIDKKD